MKSFLIIVFIAVLSIQTATAQSNFAEVYKASRNEPSTTCFSFPGWVIRFALKSEKQIDLSALKKIKTLRILTTESQEYGDEIFAKLDNDLYRDLILIQESNTNLVIKALIEEKTVKEVLIFVKEDNEYTVFNINGNLEIKDIPNLVKNTRERF